MRDHAYVVWQGADHQDGFGIITALLQHDGFNVAKKIQNIRLEETQRIEISIKVFLFKVTHTAGEKYQRTTKERK